MKIIRESVKLFVVLTGPIIAIPSIVMCSEFDIIKFGKYLIFGDEFENISKKIDCLGDDIENKIDSNNNSIITVENAIYVTCGIVVVGIIIFIAQTGFNGSGPDGGTIKEGFEIVVDSIGKQSANIVQDNHANLSQVIKIAKSFDENISLSNSKSDNISSAIVDSLGAINHNLTQIVEGIQKNENLISERVIPKLVSLLSTKFIKDKINQNNSTVSSNNIVEDNTIDNNIVDNNLPINNEILPRPQLTDVLYEMLGDLDFK